MPAPREYEARALVSTYVAAFGPHDTSWSVKPADVAAGRAILEADPTLHVAVIRFAYEHPFPPGRERYAVNELLGILARRKLPYSAEDACAILSGMVTDKYAPYMAPAVLRSLAKAFADPALRAASAPALRRLREAANKWYPSAEQRKFLALLEELIGDTPQPTSPIRHDEWGDQVLPLLDQLESRTRELWLAILRHCASAKGSAPSAKWQVAARELVSVFDGQQFARRAAEWIGAFRRSSNKPPEYNRQGPASRGCLLAEENADLLKGLAWSCAFAGDAALAAVLGDAAIAGYRKITGVGPRSAKVAGACVYALKSMPDLHGVAQLERVRLTAKQPTYVRGIEQALDEAATSAGLTREDLEELTVPIFDLVDGRVRVPIGSSVAELQVAGSDVRIHWCDASGRPRKSAPTEVQREHKAELKELKRQRDDLARMLAAQRDRLERLPLASRAWTLSRWRERYLDHPLVGGLARRLIWRFIEGERVRDGIWHDGHIVDADGTPLDPSDAVTVTPWHPILSLADEVLAWREWLEGHEVTQPFKQAHREVYLLTEAERVTRVYSNRFGAHILRQHQFNALAAARGWRNKLRLMVDDEYPPATLDLPRWGLRAEFWIEGAGDDYGVDTNDTGTYLRVATDQVRFYSLDAPGNSAHAGGGGYHGAYDGGTRQHQRAVPLVLEDIPPIVLSEIMRDVDLFVGVASIGNDPTWQDGGPQGRYRDYWHAYSFGDLSATAETRKLLLARLVPRLAIAERCALDGRFLRVRGDLRTYKIHLGSGNILMEPNDKYLCIVPGRGEGTATEHLYLPFEGDSVLAVILSKAFLLAEDTKITDLTITRQIAPVAASRSSGPGQPRG